MTISHYNCDVLVVGAGAAGIRAAIESHDLGSDVILANKKNVLKSGSSFYKGVSGWGLCAAVQPGDSPEKHLGEILSLAQGTADLVLARTLTSHVKSRIDDLESYGIDFKKTADGRYISVKPCFSETERSASAQGMDKIRDAFKRQIQKRAVTLLENCTVLGLLCADGKCFGAYGMGDKDTPVQISAKSTVLATGGGISLFNDNYSIGDLIGEGYSLALDAGAKLVNLEFIQFIPATYAPGKGLLFEQRALNYLDTVKSKDLTDVIQEISDGNIGEILKNRALHAPFSVRDSGKFFEEALYTGGMNEKRLYFRPDINKSKNWVVKKFISRVEDNNIDLFDDGISLKLFAQAFNGEY